jgi:CarD family transcriptional regulator
VAVEQEQSMAFKVGDMAVYPGHGVGMIEGVETREIAGTRQTFYVLKILENGMTIMVPTANADSIGMRDVIRRDEVAEIHRVLQERDIKLDKQTWNRRYREYMAKIKTGSPYEVARVLRDLYILKGDKNLSFGERKMFDTAKGLLVKELAVARGAPEAEVDAQVSAFFKD